MKRTLYNAKLVTKENYKLKEQLKKDILILQYNDDLKNDYKLHHFR